MTTTEKEYNSLAKQSVQEFNEIPDFGYHGELPLGETWAFTFSRTRDSDILCESNYESILTDMEEKFPDDIEEVHCNHWACGWVDHLAVKMLNEKGECTEAGKKILDWKSALENYPVANDEDFSRRESEAQHESIENAYITGDTIDNLPDDWVDQVWKFLWDIGKIDPYVADEDVTFACKELNFLEKEEDDENLS